jgi:hypothetical protein
LSRPRALGIYIYGGGFYFGVRDHWNVVAHLEDGPIINTKVFSHNVPEVPLRFAPDWDLPSLKNKVDVVYANPPCAIWSPIGRSMFHGAKSYLTDPRIECWENCVKVGAGHGASNLGDRDGAKGVYRGAGLSPQEGPPVAKEGL